MLNIINFTSFVSYYLYIMGLALVDIVIRNKISGLRRIRKHFSFIHVCVSVNDRMQ